MNFHKYILALAGLLIAPLAAQAIPIALLDTGAGANLGSPATQGSLNAGVPGVVDPYWTVSLLSTVPPGQTPPGGIPDGTAWLMPNFPTGFSNLFSYWVPNDSVSNWLTYSFPPQVGGDTTSDTFQYQLKFIATTGGVIGINWLSDNTDALLVNGVPIGSNAAQFAAWLPGAGIPVLINPGLNTVDLEVFNEPQGNGNPTGGRVEFTGNLDVLPVPATAVPDGGMSVALLGLSLVGLASVETLRRKLAAA